jgi:hypothetical protein
MANIGSIILALALVAGAIAYFAWNDDLMPDSTTKKIQVGNGDAWTGAGGVWAGVWRKVSGDSDYGKETTHTEKVTTRSVMGYVDDIAVALVAFLVLYTVLFKKKALG